MPAGETQECPPYSVGGPLLPHFLIPFMSASSILSCSCETWFQTTSFVEVGRSLWALLDARTKRLRMEGTRRLPQRADQFTVVLSRGIFPGPKGDCGKYLNIPVRIKWKWG